MFSLNNTLTYNTFNTLSERLNYTATKYSLDNYVLDNYVLDNKKRKIDSINEKIKCMKLNNIELQKRAKKIKIRKYKIKFHISLDTIKEGREYEEGENEEIIKKKGIKKKGIKKYEYGKYNNYRIHNTNKIRITDYINRINKDNKQT